jgi:hypothetical protein
MPSGLDRQIPQDNFCKGEHICPYLEKSKTGDRYYCYKYKQYLPYVHNDRPTRLEDCVYDFGTETINVRHN